MCLLRLQNTKGNAIGQHFLVLPYSFFKRQLSAPPFRNLHEIGLCSLRPDRQLIAFSLYKRSISRKGSPLACCKIGNRAGFIQKHILFLILKCQPERSTVLFRDIDKQQLKATDGKVLRCL